MEELKELAAKVDALETTMKGLVVAMTRIANCVDNLALQTTNNQIENRKVLDVIKVGVLDANLALKFPTK